MKILGSIIGRKLSTLKITHLNLLFFRSSGVPLFLHPCMKLGWGQSLQHHRSHLQKLCLSTIAAPTQCSRHLSGIISKLFEAGLYFLDPPQPRYLPKSGRPHTACQLGLRVSEKYSSDFFLWSLLFFSFLFCHLLLCTMDTTERNGKQNKKKSAPFFPL